MTSPSIF